MSAFATEDFPAQAKPNNHPVEPDNRHHINDKQEPNNAAVAPGHSHGLSGSTDRRALIATTSASPAEHRTASTARPASTQTSALLSTTTGRAPLSQASTR